MKIAWTKRFGLLISCMLMTSNMAAMNSQKSSLGWVYQGILARPLLDAAKWGYISIVKKLIGLGAPLEAHYLDEDEADEEYTPLSFASRNGHLEVVKYLVEKGANLEARASERWNCTPLLLAAQGGHLEVVKYLVKAGANIHATRGDAGLSALSFAVDKGSWDTVTFLVENGADLTERFFLNIAIKKGRLDMLTFLVKKGAKLDACAHTPPLCEAVKAGRLDMVRCLVEHRADVNIRIGLSVRGQDLNPPLYYTTAKGLFNINIAKFLLLSGARLDEIIKDPFEKEKKIDFLIACQQDQELIKLVIKKAKENQDQHLKILKKNAYVDVNFEFKDF